MGTITPKTSGAVNTSVTLWQRLKLHGMADFRKGNKLLNATDLIRCSIFLVCEENVSQEKFDPRYLVTVQNASGLLYTDDFVQNGSFWRLRELSATITAPERFAQRVGASALNLTVAGRNLHTWTKYKGFDPESNSTPGANFSTLDFLTLPPTRSWTARVNINF